MIPLSEHIIEQEEIDRCKRITGKTPADWMGATSNNLAKDLHSGRLNATRPYLQHELSWMCGRYGLDDDDIVWTMESFQSVRMWYPSYRFKEPIPPPGFSTEGYKRIMCFRLNPDRFGHFASKSAKRLVPA